MPGPFTELEDVEVLHETDKALLVRFPTAKGTKDEWIPKGQISDDSEVYENGHKGTIIVSEWIAEQKRLV